MQKIFVFLAALFFSAAHAQAPYYNSLAHDLIGDSRTADVFVSANCRSPCGLNGNNWFAQANALANQRYQLGVVQALSGCRTDQYLSADNLRPAITSKSQWLDIGPPAVNDIGPAGNNCAISPSGGSYPYVNANGVTVTPSNVANVAAGNILSAVQQATGAGKKVVLFKEPGNTAINNTPLTVASFTGSTSTTTLTVTAVSSGTIYTPQTVAPATLIPGTPGLFAPGAATPGTSQLGGSGVTANTNISAQLTGSDGAACPAVTCTGGIGTYSINITQTISSQAFTSTYSTIAALFDFNTNLEAIAAAYPASVVLVDATAAEWNFTGSATAITFKPGVKVDGTTHNGVLGGYYDGLAYNFAMQSTSQPTDIGTAGINAVQTTNLRSLVQNPLFQTATGGTNTGCTLSSGTVPSGWQMVCQNSAGTVTITQASDTNQLYGTAGVPTGGNAVTFAVTTSGAEVFRFQNALPNNNPWNLTDYLQAGMTVNVAAGSSKCTVYADNQINTNSGTLDSFALYGGATPTGGGLNDGPTTAYAYTLRTNPSTVLPNSTSKGFTSFRFIAAFSAAGNCTFTVSRPFVNRVRVYSPTTNTFSGWLLRRDLEPASNDNSPAFMMKAG